MSETTAAHTTGNPALELTSVPPFGSFLNLKGIVRNVEASEARIAVYIRVHGGWWTKPFWDSPTCSLNEDGTFSINITTGGEDEQATEIATFVVPAESYPPGLRGEPELPPDLFEKALTHVSVTRSS